MDTYNQDPPNALQVELVEGCSLNCDFCGVQGIRANRGGYKFMSSRTMNLLCLRLRRSMHQHKWNPRVELAMHGEPTMHPKLTFMVGKLGRLNPRELIVVSNGTGLVHNPNRVIKGLVDAGVTSICLDEYDGCDFVQRIRDRYTGPVPIVDYDNGSFRGLFNGDPTIVVKRDVSYLTKPFDKLNTHCGGGCKPERTNSALHKRCAKPFREMSVRWDGNISVCCNDFRGIYKIGNILDCETLDELWQSELFDAARRMLYHANRDLVPCKWCDAISPRVGLLPDKYGKQSMPKPNVGTSRLIASATAGKPYTKPVLRGWETDGNAHLPKSYSLVQLQTQPIDIATTAPGSSMSSGT